MGVDVVESGVSGYGIGILMATAFMVLGSVIAKFVPGGIHFYAWMIIAVGVVKALGILPREYEIHAQRWYHLLPSGNFPTRS